MRRDDPYKAKSGVIPVSESSEFCVRVGWVQNGKPDEDTVKMCMSISIGRELMRKGDEASETLFRLVMAITSDSTAALTQQRGGGET